MILHGDSLDVLKTLEDNSVDSVCTDPPYGLKFMGKKWDYDVPSSDLWREVLRVLKPGGHLLSFGGTRTYHRMVVNIEDAGFEIRDQIMWLYGSGFPKSHDVSKAIDKAAGAERESRLDPKWENQTKSIWGAESNRTITAPATDAAKQWQGFGTALKPANEPIVLARKPLEKGLTVAENVLKYGTGALNIDGSRIGTDQIESGRAGRKANKEYGDVGYFEGLRGQEEKQFSQGRWPANVILDEEAARVLDEQSGELKSGGNTNAKSGFKKGYVGGELERPVTTHLQREKTGGASRFFYVAKASKKERNAGLEGMPLVESGIKNDSGRGFSESDPHKKILNQNFHPTVKPIKLMRYLCKLITPPGGVVLDPFAGSGSTGVAAIKEGFQFIGIELNEEYVEIAKRRVEKAG